MYVFCILAVSQMEWKIKKKNKKYFKSYMCVWLNVCTQCMCIHMDVYGSMGRKRRNLILFRNNDCCCLFCSKFKLFYFTFFKKLPLYCCWWIVDEDDSLIENKHSSLLSFWYVEDNGIVDALCLCLPMFTTRRMNCDWNE